MAEKLSEEVRAFIDAPPSFQARVMNLDLLAAWADRIAELEGHAETVRLIAIYDLAEDLRNQRETINRLESTIAAQAEKIERLRAALTECADALTPGQWNDGKRERAKAALAAQSEEIERLMGVNLDRLLRIETALHFADAIRRKDAAVIVGEMVYALQDADRSELIEWKRERAALAGRGEG